jgi:hypothetical protein
MKRFNNGHWVASVISAGLVLLGPYALREAAAAWRSMHASACKVVAGQVVYTTAGQLANVSTTTPAVLLCPLDGDNRTPSGNTSQATVTVSGYANGNDGLQAKICKTFSGGGGGACSVTPAKSTGPGVWQLTPETSILNTQEYAYVWTRLDVQVAGSSNVVWGYVLGAP